MGVHIARWMGMFLVVVGVASCDTLSNWSAQVTGFPKAPVATLEAPDNSSQDKLGLDGLLKQYADSAIQATCPALDSKAPLPANAGTVYATCRKIEIDELCTAFFDGLEKAATLAQWSNRQFDIVGDATSTIMGLSGVPAQQLAILAGSKLALDSSFNNAEQALMLAPAPHKVRELVVAKQASLPVPSANDMAAAISQMRNYAYQCTVPGIHELVDEAISDKTLAVAPSGGP